MAIFRKVSSPSTYPTALTSLPRQPLNPLNYTPPHPLDCACNEGIIRMTLNLISINLYKSPHPLRPTHSQIANNERINSEAPAIGM